MKGIRIRHAGGRTAKFVFVAVVAPALLLSGLLLPAAAGNNATITTIAGGAALGDGGPPLQAPLAGPSAIAADQSGDLFVLDYGHHRVRKISPGADGTVGASGPTGTLTDTDDVITTAAGDGAACPAVTAGKACGDGGPALSAALGSASAIATDAAGNLYIADMQTVIRFVCMQSTPCTVGGTSVAPGTIVTIAGTGQAGFNDGAALSAQFNQPTGLALDHGGNLFIADKANYRIRELCLQSTACATYAGSIAPGNVLTVAGTGPSGSSGDNGPGTSAGIFQPFGVAVDAAENAYMSTGANEIRKVANVAADGTITTLAASSTCVPTAPSPPALCGPQGIAVGPPGSAQALYIANKTNNDVLRLDLSTPTPTPGLTIAAGTARTAGNLGDGGAATAAQLNQPEGVVTSTAGQVFVADFANNNIREVTAAGIMATAAGLASGNPLPWLGAGPALQGQLNLSSPVPSGALASYNGDVYIADSGDNVVRKVSSAGVITTVAGFLNSGGFSGDGGPATKASLDNPQGVALDRGGNLYIADTGDGMIRRVDATTGVMMTVAGVITTSFDANCVVSESTDPGYNGDGVATASQLDAPAAVAVDQVTGDVYIADTGNGLVRKLAPSGTLTTVAGMMASGGSPQQGYAGDGGPATQAELNGPSGIAVDEAGNLYIADSGNDVIREVNTSGVISTVAGSFAASPAFSGDGGAATAAGLDQPLDVAVDPGSNLYIADSANDVVRFVCAVSSGCGAGSRSMSPGQITTLGGTGGAAGFAGDGGAATSALLNRPSAVSVDPSGNVLTADANNNRIRQIADPVSYTAPPNPRPVPAGPSPIAPAFSPSCPQASSGSTGSTGSSGSAPSSGSGTPAGATDAASLPSSDQLLRSLLPGRERANTLAGRPLLGLGPASVRPVTDPSKAAAKPSPSPSPGTGSSRGVGPIAANRYRVPSAPLGPWWLALVIVGAAVVGAAGTLFLRWRLQPRTPIVEALTEGKDTQEGPRLRSR